MWAIATHSVDSAVLKLTMLELNRQDIKALTILDKYKLSLNNVHEMYTAVYNSLETTKDYMLSIVTQLNEQLEKHGLETIKLPTRGNIQIDRNEYILSN